MAGTSDDSFFSIAIISFGPPSIAIKFAKAISVFAFVVSLNKPVENLVYLSLKVLYLMIMSICSLPFLRSFRWVMWWGELKDALKDAHHIESKENLPRLNSTIGVNVFGPEGILVLRVEILPMKW